MEEHIHMIKISKEIVAGRIKIVGSAGSNNTAESVYLIKEVEKIDIDAALCITPYYNKPPQAGLYAHYEKLLKESSRVKIIIYNVPSRTGVSLNAETVIALAKLDRIVGLKEASTDFGKIARIVRDAPESFSVLSGDDLTLLPALSVGGKGVISVIGNVLPKEMIRMIDAFTKGDIKTAQQLNAKMYDLNIELFTEANPIPLKYALSRMGRLKNQLRLPLQPLAEKFRGSMDQTLMQLGLLDS